MQDIRLCYFFEYFKIKKRQDFLGALTIKKELKFIDVLSEVFLSENLLEDKLQILLETASSSLQKIL